MADWPPLTLDATRYNFTGQLSADDTFQVMIPLQDGTTAKLSLVMQGTWARRFAGTLQTGAGSSSFSTP